MMKGRFTKWFPAIIWMAVIFYLSAQTGEKLNALLPIFHHVLPEMNSFDWGHFVAYFILSCTFYWALSGAGFSYQPKFIAILLCIIYGCSDEYHQSFVSGRMPDWADLFHDAIGAALAMAFFSLPIINRLYQKLRVPINTKQRNEGEYKNK